MDSKGQVVPGAGKLGMSLLILALSVLFAASIAGYLVVRLRAGAWPPPGMPRFPNGLWLSTGIILASSFTMERALASIRKDRIRSFRLLILVTTLLGVAFLVCQTFNWLGLIAARMTAQTQNLYAFTFYMLTGLHAVHVLGGLIPLSLVTRRAYAGRYSPGEHGGVKYCQMYWHFLTAVWLVMFSLLVLFA